MAYEYRSFLWRKIHSLFGVFPLAFFLAEHFYTNSFAVRGPTVYNQKIGFFTENIPYLLAVELALIFVPIALHGLYGLWIIYSGSLNVSRYPYFRNWMYVLQRISGLAVFAFVAYHLWTLRLAKFFGHEVSFQAVAAQLDNPWVSALYATGLLATTFHLSNGLVGFGINWGLITGPRAQKAAYVLAAMVFVVLTWVGIDFGLAFL